MKDPTTKKRDPEVKRPAAAGETRVPRPGPSTEKRSSSSASTKDR